MAAGEYVSRLEAVTSIAIVESVDLSTIFVPAEHDVVEFFICHILLHFFIRPRIRTGRTRYSDTLPPRTVARLSVSMASGDFMSPWGSPSPRLILRLLIR